MKLVQVFPCLRSLVNIFAQIFKCFAQSCNCMSAAFRNSALKVGLKKPIEAPVARDPIVLLRLMFIVVLCPLSTVYSLLFIVVSSVYSLLLWCLLSTVYYLLRLYQPVLTLRIGHKKPIDASSPRPYCPSAVVVHCCLVSTVFCLQSTAHCGVFCLQSTAHCGVFCLLSTVNCGVFCLQSTVNCGVFCLLSTVYCYVLSTVQHSVLRTTNQPPLSPLFHRNLWNTGQIRPQTRAHRSSHCLLVKRTVCAL